MAPWWVSIALAGVVYAACKMAPSYVRVESPVRAGVNALIGLLPSLAHWPALFFVFIAAIAAWNRYRRRQLLDSQSDIESIRNLSWQEFELLVGESFRRQGYAVEESGGGGADGGVDLRLRRDGRSYLVQCKRWKAYTVGVSKVRELLGVLTAEGAEGAFLVSSGRFTAEAQYFAERNGITLIDGSSLAEMVAGLISERPRGTR